MKQAPLIFGLIVISVALGVLIMVTMKEDLAPPRDGDSETTGSLSWYLVGELLDTPPGMEGSGNAAVTDQQLAAALKNDVLLTTDNADEDGSGFAGMPDGSSVPGSYDSGGAIPDIVGEINLDNANLPEFLQNMSEEERAEFVKFFRRSVMKEVDRARKKLEKKRFEEKRKRAIKYVQRRMKFGKDETDYIRRQEQECWNRIKDLSKTARENKWRRHDLRREITTVRKDYRQELDEVLGEKRYTKYLDQVHRTVDPTYANRADISSLKRQMDGMRRTIKSMQKQMSALKKSKSKPKAPKR
ncbi:MAG: TroA family protein [Planctomycetota bacterium]|jgi:hypothetical protein